MNETMRERYFNWMCGIVCNGQPTEYGKLLYFLDQQDFNYVLGLDANRYEDGISLRYIFGNENGIPDAVIANEVDTELCSVLEMMVALAIKLENIADDPEIGNRTDYWFWTMIKTLGLKYMTDLYFNEEEAYRIVQRFLNREYEPNGFGGLFVVPDRNEDMRRVEIWYQAMWYLNFRLNYGGLKE